MKIEKSHPFARGIDTVLEIDHSDCVWLIRNGFDFVIRYLGRTTPEEQAGILCSGLASMLVTTSRKAGWRPSEQLGALDGAKTVQHLEDLSRPRGETVWLDLEGCIGPAKETADWVNAWSHAVVTHGCQAGLYVGANPGELDGRALWTLPNITRYWRSGSSVPVPDNRGWCMQQLRPLDIKMGPLHVDVDVIESDHRGGRPMWVVGE